MAKKTVLLTGASGNVGKATLQGLAKYADTLDVKAGVRDPAKSADLEKLGPNITVVRADPLDADFGKTLEGVDYLFVVTPGHIDRTKIAIAAVEGAKAAGVKYVLVLSVINAELTDTVFGSQFTPIEEKTKTAGVPYGIIRLPLFLENNYGQANAIKEQGTWYDAIEPEKPYTQVALQDVGEVAAKILSDPSAHKDKVYKLAAPSDTNANLAKYYTEVLGKPVTYTAVPYEGVKQALMGLGFADWQADGIIELEKLINSESTVLNDLEGAKTVEAILGRPATSIEAWVKSAAPAFQ